MADHDAQKQVEALRMEMDAMHDIMAGGCCPINSRGDKDRAAWLGLALGLEFGAGQPSRCSHMSGTDAVPLTLPNHNLTLTRTSTAASSRCR